MAKVEMRNEINVYTLVWLLASFEAEGCRSSLDERSIILVVSKQMSWNTLVVASTF